MARRRGGHGSGSPFGGGAERVPVPKLNNRNSNLDRARRRKPPGKVAKTISVLVFVALLGLAVGWFVDLTGQLSYRAGWAGTPGTLSGILCESVGTSRGRHSDCHGDFAGGGQVAVVTIEGDNSYSFLRGYPARLHADGQTASVTGGKTVAYVLGGMLATLAFVVLIGWFLVLGLVGFVVRRRGGVWRLRKWAGLTPLIAAGVLLGLGIAGGIVGAVLSF